MNGPLAGTVVVDHTADLAGGYATKLLADAGARVLRIPPPADASVPPLRPALRTHLDAGKEPFAEPPPDAVAVVVRGSIHGPPPALDPPLLVSSPTVVTITPFGLDGPWADHPATDFTLQAWCGSTALRSSDDRPPLAAGGDIGAWATGAMAALAAVAHLGRDVEVDVSALETTVALWGTGCMGAQMIGDYSERGRYREVPAIEEAADGLVGFGIVSAQQWRDFCVLIERPDWIDDEELAHVTGRFRRFDEVRAGVAAYLGRHRVADIVERAGLLRIPAAPVNDGRTILTDPYFAPSGIHRTEPGGAFTEPGPAIRWGAAGRAATVGLLGDRGDRPLAGVRVAGFTAYWAGPYATQLLGFLGADVVSVESTRHPDGMRTQTVRRPPEPRWWEWSGVFHAVNAGKRAIAVDADDEQGLDVVRTLVAGADVVVENFSPRVMDAWGLDGAGIAGLAPDAITVRMPAYGLTGPWRDRTGFQMTMEQVSGLAFTTGWPDRPPQVPYALDPVAGIHAAFAAVCGLEHRRRTGEGQAIELRMAEVAAAVAAEQVIVWTGDGELVERRGNDGPPGAVQACVAAADDEWIAVSALLPGAMASLDAVLDGFPLADWCQARTAEDAVDTLLAAGVPAATVTSGRIVHRVPQLVARGHHTVLDHALGGPLAYPGAPFRVAGSPAAAPGRPAPTLGQHNTEILADLAYGPDHVAALAAAGVIGTDLPE